jgi:DNA-3-methyladenine glycosylase I
VNFVSFSSRKKIEPLITDSKNQLFPQSNLYLIDDFCFTNKFPMSYCNYVQQADAHPLHKKYHDQAYGFPIENDNALFGRLILEINQAGLSWLTILKKQANFQKAYDQFSIEKVANYGEKDRKRLLNDAGIIRNKLKVNAAIHNAQAIVELQKEFASFKAWLDQHHPLELKAWVKLFKRHFKFVGGEICNEFLMSCGYLPGTHDKECPVYAEIKKQNPPWMQQKS